VSGRSLVVRLWALHPDIAQLPVVVAIEGSCGVVFQQELRSSRPIAIGIAVPEDVDAVDAVIRVSRTWQPSDDGGGDTRNLGVAVGTDFEGDPAAASAQDYAVEWGKCPAGR